MLVTRVPDVLCAQICNEVAVVFLRLKKKDRCQIEQDHRSLVKKKHRVRRKKPLPLFPKKSLHSRRKKTILC